MEQTFGKYVGIWGDPACRPGWQKNFVRIADILWETYRPSHVFVPGDVTQYGLVSQHEDTLKYCQKYPWEWVVTMGDHDSPIYIFERFWGPAQKVTDLGRWRFIGVNTAGGTFTEENALWLSQQIKDDTVIYSHMPPRMPGWEFHALSQKCTARFLAVLDDFVNQVRACFFGHIHSFDRKEYRGIPFFVTGAGGAAAYGLGVNGYEGTRPFQVMALDTTTGEIHLLDVEDKSH